MKLDSSWRQTEATIRRENPMVARAIDEFGKAEGSSGFMWQYIKMAHDAGYENYVAREPRAKVKRVEVPLSDIGTVRVVSPRSMARVAEEMAESVSNHQQEV